MIFAFVIADVFAYVLVASDPLIVQDAWYFLDVFVRQALNGTLGVTDFFVKRGNFDHAQPLRKLILLIELRYFHLDFRVEAVAGVLAAAGSLLFLRKIADSEEEGLDARRSLLWALICMALVTLNSRAVWDWPLVAGAFTSYVFFFAWIVAIWRSVEKKGHLLGLVLVALIFDIIADDTALIANIAALLALIWIWARDKERRTAVWRAGAALVCTVVAVRLGYAVLLPHVSGQVVVDHRLSALAMAFKNGGWWQWAIIPLGSSIAHIDQLRHMFGGHARDVQIAFGLALICAHLWFWWRVARGRVNRSSYAAVLLMLMFYALCAGIITGRVAQFGNEYLNQPRYVLFYGLGNVSLLLMACAGAGRAEVSTRSGSRRWRFGVLVSAVLLMCLWQASMALQTWKIYPYVSVYYQKMARQIGEMAKDPAVTPKGCAPELPVCHYSPAKRKKLIGLLQRHHLNLFSLSFQRTNRLYPDLQPVKMKKAATGTRDTSVR